MEIQYDPADPQTNANPYPLFAELRRREPVFWSSKVKGWVVTRHADVYAVLKDAERFSNTRIQPFLNHLSGPRRDEMMSLADKLTKWAVFADPPYHGKLRPVLAQAFVPFIPKMEPDIVEIIDQLIRDIADRREFDLIESFGVPMPTEVVARMFGLPHQDTPLIKEWSDDLNEFSGGARLTPDKHARSTQAINAMSDYLLAVLRERTKLPGDDVISRLIAVSRAAAEPLSEEELVQTCVLLVFAGHETTTDLIGNTMFHLLQHRDQFQYLRSHPEIVEDALEEFLRFESPAQCLVRIATRDTELGSKVIKRGERLFVMLSAANRDPEVFDEPDKLDLERKPKRIMSFGAGIHLCVGAPLARLEGRLAVPRLVRAFPDLHLASLDVGWRDAYVMRGVKTLPVIRKQAT